MRGAALHWCHSKIGADFLEARDAVVLSSAIAADQAPFESEEVSACERGVSLIRDAKKSSRL